MSVPTSSVPPILTDEDVANYLRQNNDFFIDKLKIIKKDIPSARIAELGKTLIASPELDTKKTIDLLIDFIEERELRTKA